MEAGATRDRQRAPISELMTRIANTNRDIARQLPAIDWLTQTMADKSGQEAYHCYEVRRAFLEMRANLEKIFDLETSDLFPSVAPLDDPRPDYHRLYGPLADRLAAAEALYERAEEHLGKLDELTDHLPTKSRDSSADLAAELTKLGGKIRVALELRREKLMPAVTRAAAQAGQP